MLSGKSGSGKDTFYEISKRIFSEKIFIQRYSFADEVKKIALAIGWNGVKDNKGIDLLQKISWAAREYDDKIWLRKIDKVISELKDNPTDTFLIITDCRYENQIEYVRNIHQETYTVRIQRDTKNDLSDNQKNHPIEISLDNYDKFDFHINNTTLKSFHKQVEQIINKLIKI